MASEIPSLFSTQQWHELFNLDLYYRVKAKDPALSEAQTNLVAQHWLKYLIVSNLSDQALCKHIVALKQKKSDQIDSRFPIHQITALHIACMRNRKPVVEMLLKVGADTLVEDQYGWSGRYVIHHRDKMRKFYAEFDRHYSELQERYEQMKGHIPALQLLEYRSLESRLQYAFQTPQALMDLVFYGTIDPGLWLDFIQKEEESTDSLFSSLFSSNRFHERTKELLSQLMLFENSASKLSAHVTARELMQKVRALFIEYEGIETVAKLIENLQAINGVFEGNNIHIRTTEEIEQEDVEAIGQTLILLLHQLFSNA